MEKWPGMGCLWREEGGSPLVGEQRGGTHRESDSLNKLSSGTVCFPAAVLVLEPRESSFLDLQLFLREAKVRSEGWSHLQTGLVGSAG